jgi:lipid A 3-O-deacylase
MSKIPSYFKALLLASAACLSFGAAADTPSDRMTGAYVDLGRAPHGGDSSNSLTLGLVVPYALTESMRSGPLSFYADYFVSLWNAPLPKDQGGYHNYYQIGAIANLRWRFNGGDSPWYTEAGIGVSQMNDIYLTPDREFSTRFQFTEQIGVGYTFGAERRQEVSLRLQHFSNADIKTPNPGENWLRVRYLYRF